MWAGLWAMTWRYGLQSSSPSPSPTNNFSQSITIHIATTHTSILLHACSNVFQPSLLSILCDKPLSYHTYIQTDTESKKCWQSSTQTTLSRCVAQIEHTPPLACPRRTHPSHVCPVITSSICPQQNAKRKKNMLPDCKLHLQYQWKHYIFHQLKALYTQQSSYELQNISTIKVQSI